MDTTIENRCSCSLLPWNVSHAMEKMGDWEHWDDINSTWIENELWKSVPRIDLSTREGLTEIVTEASSREIGKLLETSYSGSGVKILLNCKAMKL